MNWSFVNEKTKKKSTCRTWSAEARLSLFFPLPLTNSSMPNDPRRCKLNVSLNPQSGLSIGFCYQELFWLHTSSRIWGLLSLWRRSEYRRQLPRVLYAEGSRIWLWGRQWGGDRRDESRKIGSEFHFLLLSRHESLSLLVANVINVYLDSRRNLSSLKPELCLYS